jgi:FlaA1/EpsC-like NDP-sugar epimerase
LNRFRPGVVFHAAAYKHVPLTEINEDEAVLNILFGTRNVVEACEQEGVERFVLVSTDKAVDARAIMGASKRSAELLVQAAAKKSGRRYVAVRFGNVLASSGSVVPLFREQIAAGGPVTVGHQDLERYFMTVQEASSLVVSAGDLGAGGEIFVLDMGEPVSILTLAEDLIRLSGFEPGRDMQIVFTGLRPGEKMKESLFHPGETPQKTAHPRIFHAHTPGAGTARVDLALEGLEEAALSGDTATLRERLAKLVPSLPV